MEHNDLTFESVSEISDTVDHLHLSLSDTEVDNTLGYFLFTGKQVDQMLNPTNDFVSLVEILKEKENDLELAAQIGKSLLERKRELEDEVHELERQLVHANETVGQLQHTIVVKDNLIRLCTRDVDVPDHSNGFSNNAIEPKRVDDCNLRLQSDLDNISHKLRLLEEENRVLRRECENSSSELTNSSELDLVRDCMQKLAEANEHIRCLSDKLSKKSDIFMQQQTELHDLVARCREFDTRFAQVLSTNDELSNRIRDLHASNRNLTSELRNTRDKYDECLALFTEARAEVQVLRKRTRRAGLRPTCLVYSPLAPTTSTPTSPRGLVLPVAHSNPSVSCERSLASDHDDQLMSIAEELSRTGYDKRSFTDIPKHSRDAHNVAGRKVSDDGVGDVRSSNFDVGGYMEDPTQVSSGFASGSEPSEARSFECQVCCRRATVLAECERVAASLGFVLNESFEWDEEALQPLGTEPRMPGTREEGTDQKADITMSPLNYNETRGNNPAIRRSWILDNSQGDKLSSILGIQKFQDDTFLYKNCASSSSSSSAVHLNVYKRHPRLQLVKPLQGSEILQRWQRLATPSLTSALFESPPSGVLNRVSSCTSLITTATVTITTAGRPGAYTTPSAWRNQAQATESSMAKPVKKRQDTCPPYVESRSHFSCLPSCSYSPILSSVLVQKMGPTCERPDLLPTPAGISLDNYLAAQSRRRALSGLQNSSALLGAPSASSRPMSGRMSRNIARPTSPVLRGLLDISEMEPVSRKEAQNISIPPPYSPSKHRPNSPNLSAAFRKPSMIGLPHLKSVIEETPSTVKG